MRIGMVCPYSFDVPGGVQSHVLQLAEVMRDRGLEVSVLAPASPDAALPEYRGVGRPGRADSLQRFGGPYPAQPTVHGKVRRWLTRATRRAASA